ncbi:MAG TPA: hypothetical protein VF828_00920 [Patescibacteria group bacterium]
MVNIGMHKGFAPLIGLIVGTLIVTLVIFRLVTLPVVTPTTTPPQTISSVPTETPSPTATPIPDPVVVDNLTSGSYLAPSVVLTGTVQSGWMFEGSMPVELYDSADKKIISSPAKEITPGSWSSGNPVQFSLTLKFSTQAKSGYLLFKSDNPSGLADNQKSFRFPVSFVKSPAKISVTPSKSVNNPICGGIAGLTCPNGYNCQGVGSYPDASGNCVAANITPAPSYACPGTEYVNCMPGPGVKDARCSKDYLDWASANCPGFKGAAY